MRHGFRDSESSSQRRFLSACDDKNCIITSELRNTVLISFQCFTGSQLLIRVFDYATQVFIWIKSTRNLFVASFEITKHKRNFENLKNCFQQVLMIKTFTLEKFHDNL